MDIPFKKILPYMGMAIVVVVVAFFAKQNHDLFEKTIVDQTQRQLLDMVRIEGGLLDQRVSNLTQELEVLSENMEVQEAFSYYLGDKAAPGFSQLDDSYKDIKSIADSLSMVDTRGAIIYEAPMKENIGRDLSAETDIQKTLKDHRLFASGVVKTSLGTPILTYDQPVFRQGKFIGLLRAIIRLETLQAFVREHEGKDNYSFLLDQEGCLLSYPDSHYLGQNLSTLFHDNDLSLGNNSLEELKEKFSKGESGSSEYQLFALDSPHKAKQVIMAFSPVYFGGDVWSLVTAKYYDLIAAPVNKNAADNIAFAGIILLLVFLSATFLYRDQKRKNEELRSTQSLLIQSAKMEVVGKMAAGVAHEVKNPLAIILMSVDYLKNNVKSKDEDVSSCLEDAKRAVDRADTIIKGLLDFSSTSKIENLTQDVHALIEESLLLVKYAYEKSNVRVIKNFGKDIPDVSVDSNKIEQVFVNLFMNAIQAMPSGGELQIKTFLAGSSDKRRMVVVQIEDSGTGIPDNVIKDLFVPFVTTKRAKGGTGLGLSIVRNIMELHEGKITLENKIGGRGVRAMLWFKISQETV